MIWLINENFCIKIIKIVEKLLKYKLDVGIWKEKEIYKMEKEVNEEKRAKFIEFAGKRVNNVLHDIQILEPMSRSSAYDFTREDINEMFQAMEDALAEAKSEFEKKFEEKARASKKVFSFGTTPAKVSEVENVEDLGIEEVTPTEE
jgi:hypothetical protein